MHNVSVSTLKNNPSEALRFAKAAPVVVMNHNEPNAIIVGLGDGKLLSSSGTRAALGTALFRDGGLSLARAARVAQMPLSSFITHVSRLGIPVADQSADDVLADMETLDQWLATAGKKSA
jgi:predicted HTH domain antitoxin